MRDKGLRDSPPLVKYIYSVAMSIRELIKTPEFVWPEVIYHLSIVYFISNLESIV